MENIEKIRSKLDLLLREYEEERKSRLNGRDVPRRSTINSFDEGDEKSQELGELSYRVIHLEANPAQEATEKKGRAIVNLKEENERLRTKLTILTKIGTNADKRTDLSHAEQIESLNSQLERLKRGEESVVKSFAKMRREFLEVCYLLTGYRIDTLKDNIYRLSHMYAEHEEDKLYFELQHDGSISLLRNEYVDQYQRFVTKYLEEGDSFPAFLAAITLDLYKSQTQSVDMSVTMSTTILPGNASRKTFIDRENFLPPMDDSKHSTH